LHPSFGKKKKGMMIVHLDRPALKEGAVVAVGEKSLQKKPSNLKEDEMSQAETSGERKEW
jgi:co-chaperonin GroES (HSP10)